KTNYLGKTLIPQYRSCKNKELTPSSLLTRHYAVYAISPETAQRFDTQYLILTMPFVLFGIFRYLYLVYQKTSTANPTEAILRDGPFLANLALWGIAVLWIVYHG
ncbi:MAG: hypothetical protein V3S30_00685, partial [Thermoanaerobaculia bacterium]